VQNSWVKPPISLRALADLFHLPPPSPLSAIIGKLSAPEAVDLTAQIVTSDGVPLGGSVTFTLRSDGTYTFKGDMRATGFPSYHFGLQAYVIGSENVRLAAMSSGQVYGTDTPGDRQRNWQDDLSSAIIKSNWSSIRNNARLEYRLDANISGVTGALSDILKVALEAVAANAVVGLGGMLVVLGSELGAATGAKIGTPGVLAGAAVIGGMVMIFGPGFVFPAIVAGVDVGRVVDSDIKSKALQQDAIDFARRVFGDTIPYDRIICTNISHDGDRKFTIPDIEGSILLNLGDDAYDSPTTYANGRYATPGQVFIHEMTHAWQIANASFVPGFVCDALEHLNHYSYYIGNDRKTDTDWLKSWGDWYVEQQAEIVDDWFGQNTVGWYDPKKSMPENLAKLDGMLNSGDALNDPAFHYIRDNIRAGRT
jgi:hypothetical protein